MNKDEKKGTNAVLQEQCDPILMHAWKIFSVYAEATGTNISVVDQNYLPINDSDAGFRNEEHINAIKEAIKRGGSYIYDSEQGFPYWTSPIFIQGRFAGAVIASGAGDPEKIKALSEIMLLCAESLSKNDKNFYETLRRKAEQQAEISKLMKELKSKQGQNSQVQKYPLNKEKMLLASLRRGDAGAAGHILNELLAVLLFSNQNDFNYLRFRAIELVVLITRADINPGYAEKNVLETNSFYLKQIQDAGTIEELTDILHITVERMAEHISSFQGIRHAQVLKKADRYIRENFIRKISLQEIAKASGLSPPYFSTVFKEEMGENLSSYLNRLRVEKASHLLLETSHTLSEIAGSCGFEDQSWFSKIFKSFTGISPGKYRSQGGSMVKEISDDNFSDDFKILLNE
jgi:AraC-like DNA-binding protein/ligand-binding sensor protein